LLPLLLLELALNANGRKTHALVEPDALTRPKKIAHSPKAALSKMANAPEVKVALIRPPTLALSPKEPAVSSMANALALMLAKPNLLTPALSPKEPAVLSMANALALMLAKPNLLPTALSPKAALS